jgi:tetratricopeptide (TPR) repeat protein
MADTSSDQASDRRLNSGNEIAAFFGRDERTVKRWETARGLPVRRVPGGTRTTVFAYVRELEQWLSGTTALTDAGPATVPSLSPERAAGPATTVPPIPFVVTIALALFLLGLAASALVPSIWGRPETQRSEYAAIPEARDLYLQGAYLWEKRTPDSLREAEGLFRRAVEIDPNCAQALAGLATYNLLREYSAMPAVAAYAAAVEAGRRAVALDPTDAEAVSALAFSEFYGLRLIDAGLARFEAALALDPSSAQSHHWLGNALLHLGRVEEALEHIERAQELDP